MDHVGVVKRAFQIAWNYKLLWVFGVVLALTSGGVGGGGGGNAPTMPSGSPQQMDVFRDLESAPQLPFPPAQLVGIAVAIGVLLLLTMLVLVVISIVAKYVSLAAVIRLVDDYEETEEKRTLGQGLALGWSRRTWRLWLVHVVIFLPVAIVTVALLLMAMAPLLLWITGETGLGVAGTVTTVCLFFPVVLIVIVASVLANLLARFAERSCALAETGVIDSIKRGYATIRANLKDVGLMWLLMVGVGMLWALVSLFAFGLLALLGFGLGAIPALLVGLATSMVAEGAVPWLLGGLVGLPICVLVVIVPSVLLQGWYQVFQANVWTLTYRELKAE